MPLPPFRTLVRHPASVALRLLLWPVAILGLGNLAALTQDDGLGAGLLAFAVMVALAFVLALADGLVLRTRPLLLVWSVTTVVVAGWMSARPLIDFFQDGPAERTTWTEAVDFTLADLPSSIVFFLVLVGVPVAVGAVTGSALRRSFQPRGGQGGRSSQLGVPRA